MVDINDIESNHEKYVWCPSGLNFGTTVILMFINDGEYQAKRI